MVETFILASQRKKTVLVSPAEIEQARSPTGGWTKETLARWGVAWPPKHGWKRGLIEEYERVHGKTETAPIQRAGPKKFSEIVDVADDISGSSYLVRMVKDAVTGRMLIGSDVAHIWDGSDTACRMWSTSEMSRQSDGRQFVVYEHNPGLRVCRMCRSNAAKPVYKRTVTWGDIWSE